MNALIVSQDQTLWQAAVLRELRAIRVGIGYLLETTQSSDGASDPDFLYQLALAQEADASDTTTDPRNG